MTECRCEHPKLICNYCLGNKSGVFIQPYPDSIGEIILYDGSFRLAINDVTWERMQKVTVELLSERLAKNYEKSHPLIQPTKEAERLAD